MFLRSYLTFHSGFATNLRETRWASNREVRETCILVTTPNGSVAEDVFIHLPRIPGRSYDPRQTKRVNQRMTYHHLQALTLLMASIACDTLIMTLILT